jgi:hypothetical protein
MCIERYDYKEERFNTFEPNHLYKKVLSCEINHVDEDYFFNNIYSKNDYINKKAKDLLEIIYYNPNNFYYIHGYSRNGKSTFIRYALWAFENAIVKLGDFKSEISLIPVVYDFSICKKPDFYSKLVMLIETNIRDSICNQKSMLELKSFVDFFDNFKRELLENQKNDYIDAFCSDLLLNIKKFCQVEYSNFNTKVDLHNNFRKTITDKLKISDYGKYFCFLIIWDIFKKRNEKIYSGPEEQQKLIYILDNIDDYLNTEDKFFPEQPQFELIDFIRNFSIDSISIIFSDVLVSFSEKNKELSYNQCFRFEEQIKIVFVFRTANFLVFSNYLNSIYGSFAESYITRVVPKGLLYSQYFKFNSIKNTYDILKKRVNAIKKEVTFKRIAEPKGLYFTEFLSKKLSEDKHKSNCYYQLCNGDKNILQNYLTGFQVILGNEYYEYDLYLRSIEKSKFYFDDYLLGGVYLFFFLRMYFHTKLESIMSTIKSLEESADDDKKNIRRFIMNYIVNVSESRKKNSSMNIMGLEAKGVGLLEVYQGILEFVKKVNSKAQKNIYKEEEIDSFFSQSFSNRIDFFGNFFTVYKSQVNPNKTISNYYDLDEDVKFMKDCPNFPNCQDCDKCDRIRIFNNDITSFFSRHLITHFELFSTYGLKKSKHARNLLYKQLIFSIRKSDKKKKVKHESHFEFYAIINRVYNKVSKRLNSMVNFYTEYLLEDFPPQEFVKNEYFTVFNPKKFEEGSFQFRLVITTHISYLEGFRQCILTNVNEINYDDNEIRIASIYLIKMIINYIQLYVQNFKKIVSKCISSKVRSFEYGIYMSFIILRIIEERAKKVNGSKLKENCFYESVLDITDSEKNKIRKFVKTELENLRNQDNIIEQIENFISEFYPLPLFFNPKDRKLYEYNI